VVNNATMHGNETTRRDTINRQAVIARNSLCKGGNRENGKEKEERKGHSDDREGEETKRKRERACVWRESS